MTTSSETLTYADVAALSRAAADMIATAAHAAVAARGRFTICLSGGSTPRTLYQLLAAEYRDRVPWAATWVYFGDERCVPPNDPESNYGTARSALLSQIPGLESRTARIEGERPAADAAARYEAVLRTAFGATQAAGTSAEGASTGGTPAGAVGDATGDAVGDAAGDATGDAAGDAIENAVGDATGDVVGGASRDVAGGVIRGTTAAAVGGATFDILLLGVGPDGHTASLFPGSPALGERARWVVATDAPSTMATRARVTLTYPALDAASTALVLCAGADKRDILGKIRAAGADAGARYPVMRIAPRERLRWLLDRAAAADGR